MAYQINIGIQPLTIKHNWMNKINLEATLNEALLSCLWDFELSYQDYIGIYHQIIAIELGYVKL